MGFMINGGISNTKFNTVSNALNTIRDKFKSSWGIDYTGKPVGEYANMIDDLANDISKFGQRTDYDYAFYSSAIRRAPYFDTSNVTTFSSMFKSCNKLEYVPAYHGEKASSISAMFLNCTVIKKIAFINLGASTGSTSFFQSFMGCYEVEEITGIETAKANSVNSTFQNCRSLKEVTMPDTSECTNYSCTFYRCLSLTTINNLNLSGGTGFSQTFSGCSNLQNVIVSGTIKTSISLSDSPLLSHESLMSFINALADGVSGKILDIGSANLAKLTDEEKAIAIGKGWALT